MSTKSMLIVEDEDVMSNALETRFSKRDFEVQICTDGESALVVLSEKKFSVILLDLVMPKKDGFAVLEEISTTLNGDTPVFVITNLGKEEHLKRAKSLGAKECFVKSQTSLQQITEQVLAKV